MDTLIIMENVKKARKRISLFLHFLELYWFQYFSEFVFLRACYTRRDKYKLHSPQMHLKEAEYLLSFSYVSHILMICREVFCN
ncbi:hypothetical protein X975_04837, partial [Stegodyphus mimosarum]